MKQVLNRLANKPFSFQMIFWMALGPFFLVATLCALLMQFSDCRWLSLVAMSGLVLCWTLRLKGFIIAAALMAGVWFLQPPVDVLGSVCFIAPILSALFLTALCVQEVQDIMLKRDTQIRNLAKLKSGLEQDKQKELTLKQRLVDENQVLKSQLEESKKWTASLKRLMLVGQKETQVAQDLQQKLHLEYQQKERRIKELEKQLFTASREKHMLKESSSKSLDTELLAKLNDVRVRSFQLELLTQQYRDQLKALKPKLQLLARLKADNLQLEHREQKQIEKACQLLHKEHAAHIEKLSAEYEARIEKLQQQPNAQPASNAEKLYQQLRVQFDAKDATLHEVRKELYKAHGELYTAQLLLKESKHLPSDELKVLYRYAHDLREEITALEAENALLQGLIRDSENLTATGCDH